MLAGRRPHAGKPGCPSLCYEDAAGAGGRADFAWPRFDENSASTICFTSGTTGNPKGVVYSHRAAVLQTLLAGSFDFLPGHQSGMREVMMPMAPMFHGNAWNFPFLAPYTGSKLVLPGRNYEPEKLYELLEGEKVTITCGVPSFWLILTDWLDRTGKRFSKLRVTLVERLGAPAQPDREARARLRRRARPGLGHDRGADVDLRVAEARARRLAAASSAPTIA